VLAALGIFVYGFRLLGRSPSPLGLLASLVLLGTSVLLLYSLWILTVSAAFYVVKVDNLTYFFTSIFDAARWPASVFRGVLAFIFTFVIPIAVMTTFPAEAMLGRLAPMSLVWSVVGSIVFAFVSRRVWLHSIGHYTSASS
jgi:ABC-2 type transport system permease protein